MRVIGAAVGLMGLLAAGIANAALVPMSGSPIYSSFITSAPDTGSLGLDPTGYGPGGNGSPILQQFNVSTPTTLTSLAFRLADSTPRDGGSILVYLIPDSSGSPAHSATTLTNKTLLGTILDSALPTPTASGCSFAGSNGATLLDACNTILPVSTYVPLAAGSYWIALVNASDTVNGSGSGPSSQALWYRTNSLVDGLNTVGELNSHLVDPNGFKIASGAAQEMQVNTPEPASIALLGAGLAGLGMAHRRRKAKSAA